MSTPLRQASAPPAPGLFMLCLLACIWVLAHRYRGLTQDGELYAMQALSRLQPALRGDLYLANTSQDQFSSFSALYAFLMRRLGLWNAGVALFIACRVSFYAAAWMLLRRFVGASTAWLSLALLISASGQYGAYGVFSFAENYLTARSLAEALVVFALGLAVGRRWVPAWSVIALAFSIHPIMSLPGAVALACLAMPLRRAALLAASALAMAAVAAVLMEHLHLTGALQVVDGRWLEVVRQRSQFLFLEEWRWSDWAIHIKPMLCLILAYLVLDDQRVRHLCVAAGLVGTSGLALAVIAGSIGPIAILLQSQPWRWFWIATFSSIILLGPLMAALWQQGGAGRTSAALVAIGWVFPAIDGMPVEAAALVLWLSRGHLGAPAQRMIGIAGYLIIASVAAWTIGNAWTSVSGPIAENMDSSLVVGQIRAICQMQTITVFLIVAAVLSIGSHINPYSFLCLALLLIGLAATALPGTFAQRGGFGTPLQIKAFSDWRDAIPQDSTVLPIPPTVGATFAWFTLGRASYLSLDQSSGVIFSRNTAEEVARRSQVLLPVTEPDYEIKRRIAKAIKQEDDRHPLTEEKLRRICEDRQLGFVIASESLGLPSLLHSAPGLYNGWRMYDCRPIRDMGSD